MRPEPNNEIDLLLRQLSRRNGAPVSEIDEQHLDADELNSYVANALPAAARARYTAHLADCSSCRKLVVELSAAQGPLPASQGATVPAPWGLKSFLASLFSPLVLRYAVPALGLIIVAVVGIGVWRQQRGNSIAGLVDRRQNTAVPNQPAGESAAAQPYYDSGSNSKNEDRQRQAAVPEPKEDQIAKVAPVTRDAPAAVANQPAETTGTAAATEPPPPAAPKAVPAEAEPARDAERDKQKSAEGAAPQTAAPAANVSKDGLARGRTEDANKNEPQKTDTSVTVASGIAARKDISVRPAKGAGTGAVADSKPAQAQEKMRSQARSEEKEADEAGETRSVAGRRFRKSGRVWIDTAFDSSKSITTVARGSEQYRALVADEPSLRKIADELDGEIVVVWKGSTYRIR